MARLTIDFAASPGRGEDYFDGRRGSRLWKTLSATSSSVQFEPSTGLLAGYNPIVVSAGEHDSRFRVREELPLGFAAGDRLILYFLMTAGEHADFRFGTYEHITGCEVFVRHVIARADVSLKRRLEGAIPPAAEVRVRSNRKMWDVIRDHVIGVLVEAELRGLNAAEAFDVFVVKLGVSEGSCFRNDAGDLVSVRELLSETATDRKRAVNVLTELLTRLEQLLELSGDSRLDVNSAVNAIRAGHDFFSDD